MRYGLIGEKLGHSYSKLIHEQLGDYTYDLIPLTKEELKEFMEKKEFTAINITIPYKKDVIPYLTEISPLAEEIGAVNTIINREGKLYGYNTDFYGFLYIIQDKSIPVADRKCIILGNGGTSRTVRAALSHLGAAEILVVSRTPDEECISYEECYQNHKDAQVIVNTTPVGMYPNINASPLDLSGFTGCEAVIDVINNPACTLLMQQAQDAGIKTVGGLKMVVAQAKQAVEYFLDTTIEDQRIEEVYENLLKLI